VVFQATDAPDVEDGSGNPGRAFGIGRPPDRRTGLGKERRMKAAVKCKMAIDLCMTAAILVSMSFLIAGVVVHEWIGAALLALFVSHNFLNWSWYRALPHGKYPAARVFRTTVNLLTLLAMTGAMASGVILSQHVFSFVSVSGLTAFARKLHMLAVYWGFALMSLHLGTHWSMVAGWLRLPAKRKALPEPAAWALRGSAALVAAYGVYAFVKHGLADYMLLRVQFAYFDLERHPALFFLDYGAMMVFFFGSIAYYIQIFLSISSYKSSDNI
jgi:hypothetical protein